MTVMKLDRFMNVARWNFAINRSHYLKLALGLFFAMSLPLLLFILTTMWMSAVTGNAEYALASLPGTGLGTWMCGCFYFALPLMAGYTFHNLLTKQTRIKELTLPASNGEKFLFHALVTIGGALLTYVVSFFLLAALQYVFVGVFYGFSHAQWVPYCSIFFNTTVEAFWEYLDGYSNTTMQVVIGDLALMAFVSTFVLGNAIKYKHGVLWTLLFHWTLSFFIFFCVGLSLPLLAEVDLEWLFDWLNELGPEAILNGLRWLAIIILTVIIVFCWWMSYRLYCHAQITTKRNK